MPPARKRVAAKVPAIVHDALWLPIINCMPELHPTIIAAADGKPVFVVLPFSEFEALRDLAAKAEDAFDAAIAATPIEMLDAMYAAAAAGGPSEDMAEGFAKRARQPA